MSTKPAHRPTIYFEPTRPVAINMPKGLVDWLDEKTAFTPHHSRSRLVVDLLDQIRLEEMAQEFKHRPV